MSSIIELKQKPIISYDLIKQKGEEVAQKIAELNIEQIEASENNLKVIKSTRAELSREFKELEERRKMVKDLILKPYNEFEAAYKEYIATRFKDADVMLKSKVSVVEDGILQKKIDGIKQYFNEKNQFDFIEFDDLGLNIIRSKSDKAYKDQIDAYLDQVSRDIETIETLEHKDRVLAKYQLTKDLSNAISETNIEMQREEAIKKQKEEAEARRLAQEAAQEQAEADAKARHKEEEIAYVEHVAPQVVETKNTQVEEPKKPQLYKTSFTVTGTAEQIKELKIYMNEKGLKYESK